ncbi:MAG: Lar family restriction alleviation protein [Shewanella sp.]|uniref:Lar family restriction alleviation protein n=1 Tax=Shewanella sp. TaxID=50422 RepID=UPI003F3592B9
MACVDNVTFLKPEYGTIKPVDGGYTLKSCPFCNSTPTLEQDSDFSWYVACVNKRCFILPLTLPLRSRISAVNAWNNRMATHT